MKKILTLIIVLTLTIGLAGCGANLSTDAEIDDGKICQLQSTDGIKKVYECDYYYTQDYLDEVIEEMQTEIYNMTPLTKELSLTKGHYYIDIVVENGYIVEYDVCNNLGCTPNVSHSTNRFLNYEEQILLDEMQEWLDTLGIEETE